MGSLLGESTVEATRSLTLPSQAKGEGELETLRAAVQSLEARLHAVEEILRQFTA